MTSHRIGRLEVEVVVGEVELAAAIRDRISRLLNRGLASTIERVCDELSGPERLDRIDELRLELRSVRLGHFERDLLRALEEALRRALGGALSATGDPPRGRVRASLELLEVFTLTGNSPWWATSRGAADDPLRDAARAVVEAAPPALWRLLEELADDRRGLARLARLVDVDDLVALVERRWSPEGAALATDIRRLAAAVDALTGAGARRGALLRQAILAALGASESAPSSLLASIIRAADERGLAASRLARRELPPTLHQLVQALAASRSRARGSSPDQRTSSRPTSTREVTSPTQPDAAVPPRQGPLAADARDAAHRERALRPWRETAAPRREAASDEGPHAVTRRAMRLAMRLADPASPAAHSQRVEPEHAHTRTRPRRESTAPTTTARGVAEARATARDRGLPGADARTADARARRPAPPHRARRERDRDPLRDRREARRRDAWSRLGELYVDDAGLVILWPFLERLFARTQLLGDEQRFDDEPARARGIALLSVLARRDPEPPEPLLALAKLLCGASPQAHLELERPLTDDQQIECERLLLAVLDYVPALGDITADDLRATFLRRPAALAVRDGVWTLAVERRPQDLVLERFPWSWRWLKLPWMPEPLRVEW